MGTLSQRIHQDIKSAMIRRDHLRRNTLRLLKSAIDYAALKSGKDDLSDLEVIRVIQKEAKKRKEAREQFLKGGRAPSKPTRNNKSCTFLKPTCQSRLRRRNYGRQFKLLSWSWAPQAKKT